MVGVLVGGDRACEPQVSTVPQEWRHHARAGVEPHRASRARVHEQHAAVGRLDDDRVALADVEDDDAQAAVGGPEQRPHRDGDGEREQDEGRRAARSPDVRPLGTKPPPDEPQREGSRVEGDGDPVGRRQVHDRPGHRGRERDHGAESEQNWPDRVEADLGCARAQERGSDREEPRDRGHARQGHDPEVHDDADRRELVEVGEGDRQNRELGRRADSDRAGDHAARHRRRYDAGGRGEGELKARVEQVTRADGEDRQRGEGEAVGDRSLPLEEQRREN